MTYTQHNLHNNIQSYADERGPPHATWYRDQKTKTKQNKKKSTLRSSSNISQFTLQTSLDLATLS